MLQVMVKINYDNDELFCFECKNRINIGEKYLIIIEQVYNEEIIQKPVHLDCIEETFEDDEQEILENYEESINNKIVDENFDDGFSETL